MDPFCSDTGYDDIAKDYDLMMGDRDEYVQFYSSLLSPGLDSLVDFGCGSGLVTVELANLLRRQSPSECPRVAGIDVAPGMIGVASARCPNITWKVADLSNFNLSERYQLGVCMYNTLQHLDADGLEAAFRCIRAVIEDGGVFSFDIYNPNREYLSAPQCNRLARTISRVNDTPLEIREDTEFDQESSLLSITWRLLDPALESQGLMRKTQFTMWQHDPTFVQSCLAKTGFSVSHLYGDLDASNFNKSSRKQIYVCHAD